MRVLLEGIQILIFFFVKSNNISMMLFADIFMVTLRVMFITVIK